MKRLIVAFAFVFLAIGGLFGVARADCGAHQLTVRAAQFRAIEAMPLTLTNVYSGAIPSTDAPRVAAQSRLSIGVIRVCPEDSHEAALSQVAVADLWTNALAFQNRLAAYRFARLGLIHDPAPCLPLFVAAQRAEFLSLWNAYAGAGAQIYTRALVRDAFFGHVKTLWLGLALQFGLRLSPVGVDVVKQVQLLDHARDVRQAHLPDGIRCAPLPGGSGV
jgi:hypothetical protein